jgi:1,4-alpha-glucan branching enzyme
VLGDFNDWDTRRHVMRKHHEAGYWDMFIPGVGEGANYKFEIHDANGRLLPLKADPVGSEAEHRPNTASKIVAHRHYPWQDDDWMSIRGSRCELDKPISIYEIHLGSWRRGEQNRFLNYREIAQELVPYVKELGFTHVQFLPVSEHPFDGSWGYQPVGLFAPTSRHGNAEDFKYLIEKLHQADIGVLLDWVPGHFPSDEHGLARFDGSPLYEYEDPREGFHPDWNTYIYNYASPQVANFLRASAMHWIDRYHVDGIRVDAVASMLYRNYSRNEGEWIPNIHGGHENLEAIDFLKGFNEELYGIHPGVFSVAEESTAWPKVSKPTHEGGLGFGFKWNMGWMNDSLEYISKDPIHRKYHHNDITFSMVYAFDEQFILPLSHDEVVHGKGSILGRMPGDTWQQFANLRAYYGFMWTHPGKKLMFMGCEFGQGREWNHDASLDWHLLDVDWHQGMLQLIKDLNRVYCDYGAMHQKDTEHDGFEWIDGANEEQSILAFCRYGFDKDKPLLVISNFTPTTHTNYQVGVPLAGTWREIINTDAQQYQGSGVINEGHIHSQPEPCHGREQSLRITVPPLATIILECL